MSMQLRPHRQPPVGGDGDLGHDAVAAGPIGLVGERESDAVEHRVGIPGPLRRGAIRPERMRPRPRADLRQPHVMDQGRAGHGPVAGQQQIALAQLDGIEPERAGRLVHQAFDGVEGLGTAEAPHRSGDDARARHGRGIDHDLVEAIAAAAGEGGELGDPLAVIIGAARLQAHPALDRLEPARGIDRQALLDAAAELLQPGGELLEAVAGDPAPARRHRRRPAPAARERPRCRGRRSRRRDSRR